ncbi:unnamed protein product [Boreogadus saida]
MGCRGCTAPRARAAGRGPGAVPAARTPVRKTRHSGGVVESYIRWGATGYVPAAPRGRWAWRGDFQSCGIARTSGVGADGLAGVVRGA